MTYRRSENNMHDALYMVACNYPEIPGTKIKGIQALAQTLGMSAQTLRNKLSPDIETHKVSFEEASAIMELCARAGMQDAYAPLLAMAWRHGYVAIEQTEALQIDDESIHRCASDVMAHVGAVAGAVNEALADDHIGPVEMEKIESRFRRATARFNAWFTRVRNRAQRDGQKRSLFRKACGSFHNTTPKSADKVSA